MTTPEIQQLQDQQSLLTQALSSLLQGHWCGAPPSAQAFVSALDPNQQVDCLVPVLQSDEPEIVPGWDASASQPGQLYNWTCSLCATEWAERAAGSPRGADIYANREACGQAVGYPQHINEVYGLMDGSGSQLRRVLKEQTGRDSSQGWLDFDTAYAIYSQSFGMMSGGAWYHWVGVRGVDGAGNLWVANSAPGYQGVWDVLSRADFNRLGPFSCVWVTA